MDIWGPRSEFLSNFHQNWHTRRFYGLPDDVNGFFANINMKAINKVKGSQVVVELFILFLAFMLMLAKNPFNIIRKPIKAPCVPILVKIGQKL